MLALPQENLSLRQLAARFALPLATFAAMRSFTAYDMETGAAGEGAFLALFSGALLGSVALCGGPLVELALGSLLSAAAVWCLPAGPSRGTVVGVVLVSTLLAAALRRLPEAARRRHLPLSLTLGLALGAQILLRGHLLFAPERTGKTLFALLALPCVGALAVWWAARRHGVSAAVCAAAASLLLAPGWNVSSTLGWVGLVAGEELLRKESSAWTRGPALLLALGVLARTGLPGLAFLLCGAVLSAPLPALGAALAAAIALLWPFGATAIGGIVTQAFWCLLVVPSLALPATKRWPAALAALLLAIALPLLPNPGVLAAPLALAVLASSARSWLALPRAVWIGSLFAIAALLASYPWLRPTPLPAALALFGLTPGWRPLLVLAAGVAGLALLGRRWTRSATDRPAGLRLVGLSAGLALLAACLQLPRPSVALLTPEVPVVLDAAHPAWRGGLPAGVARTLVFETSLANAAALPHESAVARVRLFDARGEARDWVLRAGVDSGEWAAQRSDVRQSAVLASPAPWVSWIADGFFAQRYRCRREIPAGFRAVKVAIERSPSLPAEVALALHQVEVAP